jgi:hypothetical protein
VTLVRIVFSLRSRPGGAPDNSGVTGQHLIVLADDAGQRAAPLWIRVVDAKGLWHLLDQPAEDTEDAAMAGGLRETAVRLLDAAAVAVTAVDIEPASADEPELRWDTVTARVGLASAAGTRHVPVSADYGLALAAIAGVPVRVPDEVMDRLAVPVQGGDMLAPFLPPAADRAPGGHGRRRRFEPRNMAFADGLDYWELAGSFSDATQPRWQDYSCAATEESAVLASAVPEPSGFAVLTQTIYADDYRGDTVTFRGRLRTVGVAGHAGLYLAAGRPGDPAVARPRDGNGGNPAGPGSGNWAWHELTVPVPGDARVIRFGISLTGSGRVELRDAELTPARPDTQPDTQPGTQPGTLE